MSRLPFILVFSMLSTSCATLMNRSDTSIVVYTTEPSLISIESKTFKTYENKTVIPVERKNEALKIIASTDSLRKEFSVEPRNSAWYWLNIPFNYGIGMIVDGKKPKRYAYPKRIFVDSKDSTGTYEKFGRGNRKGEWQLHVSLPHVNSFLFVPEHEGVKTKTGFMGLSAGLDHYHTQNQYLSVGIWGVMDLLVPVPAPIDYSGEHAFMRSGFITLSNNHRLGRFSVGYGLAYVKNTWDFVYFDRFDPPPPTRKAVKRSHNALGFFLPAYFQTGENFHIGVLYRPTFFRSTLDDKFVYEHLISVDLAWKIGL